MIVLAGRVTTPVPNRPYIFTGVPVSRVATVLPGVPHVKAQLPESPKVRAGLPSAPHYRTRRPPTKNRLVAGNTTTVSGSAVVHARLGVEFAEQSVQVDQAGKIAVGLGAVSAVGVSGSALVRALYRVDASNAVGVAGSGAARARHTLAASQAIATATDGGDARALYSLTAAQNIVVDQPVESRPFIDVAASQDVGVVSAASSVPSVGTVNADAVQDIGVDSAAIVRVRHAVNATQEIVSGESTVLDGLRVPLAASQGVAVVGAGDDARALYTLTATGAATATGTAAGNPALAAVNTTSASATATARPVHTIAATSSTTTDGSATTTIVTYTRQRMNKSGAFTVLTSGAGAVTGWASDATAPATVSSNRYLVVSTTGVATVTLNLGDYTGAAQLGIYQAGVLIGQGNVTFSVTGVSVTAGQQFDVRRITGSATGGTYSTGYLELS